MAEPKKRLTSARSGARRSHLALKPIILGKCPKCGQAVFPHRVCPTCGYYKSKDVLELARIEVEKAKRKKQREQKE